jgi:uncharacterized protein YwgA
MSIPAPKVAESEKRAARLAAFISFLKKELGYEFKIHEKFEDRLKLQKYVFIADHFGLNSGYDFSMYVRGPYSPELAEDYYRRLDVESTLPPEFRSQDFINLVKDKDVKWLEIAATVLLIYDYNRERGVSREDIIKIATKIKPWANERVNGVLDELIKSNLIRL